MKKIQIIAGASAAVLALGVLTACGKKQEPVEEMPVVQEETLEVVTPEIQVEEEPVQEFPLERVEEEEVTEEPELTDETEARLVAEVTGIAEDGSVMIQPYVFVAETAEEDSENVDFSAYTAEGEEEELILTDTAVFFTMQNGELMEADETALTVGSMLVITDNEGVQNIVIHAPAAEEA